MRKLCALLCCILLLCGLWSVPALGITISDTAQLDFGSGSSGADASDAASQSAADKPAPAAPGSKYFDNNPLTYTNPQTGYRAIVIDDADLLTSSEEQALLRQLKELTANANFAFWTCRKSGTQAGTKSNTEKMHIDLFGRRATGSIVCVDMASRYIFLDTEGAFQRVVPKSEAEIITNNVRSLLSSGRYAEAAADVFAQIKSELQGEQIARPMKYLSNAAIAVMIGLFALLTLLMKKRSVHTAPVVETTALLRELQQNEAVDGEPVVTVTRKYSPESSDSGGSSCSSCGSGSSCSSCSSCGGGSSF